MVDVDALRRGEDWLEPGIGIGDRLLPVVAACVRRNVRHRTRSVERHECDQILEDLRLDLTQRVAHAGALELEDARRIALAEHGVRRLVVQRKVGNVDLRAAGLLDHAHGLVDHIEVAQTEEVHLQETECLDVAHRVLRDDFGVDALALQRQVLHQWSIADHDGGRVDRVLPHQAFERTRHVDQLLSRDLAPIVGAPNRRGIVVHRPQVLARREALVEADLDAVGNALGDAIDDAVG